MKHQEIKRISLVGACFLAAFCLSASASAQLPAPSDSFQARKQPQPQMQSVTLPAPQGISHLASSQNGAVPEHAQNPPHHQPLTPPEAIPTPDGGLLIPIPQHRWMMSSHRIDRPHTVSSDDHWTPVKKTNVVERSIHAPHLPSEFVEYDHSFLPTHEHITYHIPFDNKHPRDVLMISLQDAILLALRYNPDVENSEMQRVVDKYNLYLAQREFYPKYTLTGAANFAKNIPTTYDLNGSVEIKTPIGTTITADYANTFTNTGNTPGDVTLTLEQPLLRGFGFVNKIALLNAYDAEDSAKLAYKDTIITVVDQVVTDYRSLVEDLNNLEVQRQNLISTEEQVKQYELQVKVGQAPRSDLTQYESTLESSRLAYVQQKDSVRQSYLQILQDMGLTLTAKINIDTNIHMGHHDIPSTQHAIDVALHHNIAYQQALLALPAAERQVIQDKNDLLPNLDLKATQEFGENVAAAGPGADANSTLTLSASIPIDNVEGKAQLVEDKIAVDTDKLNLQQQKEALISTIINDIDSIENAKQTVEIGIKSVALLEQTYNDAKLRAKYGQANLFEVTTDQISLLQGRISLISDKIGYLNAIEQLNKDMGVTLERWNIKLRY